MMRRPQWSGSRMSTMDRIIRRFQDRWEMDRQYRAIMSGALGLVMIVALCSCMGVVTTVANNALAGVSSARNADGSQNANTGTGQINGVPTFPTSTVPPWTQSGPPPYTIIPNSQTPVPAPTHPPTATPAPNNGGGGNLPTTCNGNQGRESWALTPCPQLAGQNGTLTISAQRYPNATLNIVLSFGSCNNCTYLFTPQQGYKLDANGQASITYTVPAGAANSTVPISGMINIGGGPSLGIDAAPVQ